MFPKHVPAFQRSRAEVRAQRIRTRCVATRLTLVVAINLREIFVWLTQRNLMTFGYLVGESGRDNGVTEDGGCTIRAKHADGTCVL